LPDGLQWPKIQVAVVELTWLDSNRSTVLMTSIFPENLDNSDRTPINGESQAAYLRASGRAEARKVRKALDDLLSIYPESDREQLVTRIRSDDDVAHTSAVFELTICGILVAQGFSIEAVEPNLETKASRPDFLVRSPQGQRFYLEATLATGETDTDRRTRRRFEAAIGSLDSVQSNDFWLDVTPRGNPNQPIRLRQLRTKVERWLGTLNYEAVRSAWPDGELPILEHEESGFSVELKPIPRNDRSSPRSGGAIGVQMGAGWSRSPGQVLKGSILGKAKQYGSVDLPLVIAVNALDHHGGEYDTLAALLGQEVIHYSIESGSSRTDRDWDGVWTSPNGQPRRASVSAVWVFDTLSAWRLAAVESRIVFNPFARLPLGGICFGLDEYRPVGDALKLHVGSSVAQILNLPDGWPRAQG
jgi:hypothetical protein